jgi:predicted house-cleaning noncanonical NTP pyrophosphatase (MazG superfamily)
MRKIYGKLVRDGIPRLLNESKVAFEARPAGQDELDGLLISKLTEETEELRAGVSDAVVVEELGDLLEVVYSIAARHGASPGALEKVRLDKLARRGGFEGGVVLEWTEAGDAGPEPNHST